MNENIQVGFGNMLISAQSFINALDELKGTPFYQGDIKKLVDQLLNKLQSRFKKQFQYMFSEENAEVAFNLLRDYEKFNQFSVNQKQLLYQMADYYLEDSKFWESNFIVFFEKLNRKPKNESRREEESQ